MDRSTDRGCGVSDVLDELAACVGLLERGAARRGLEGDWVAPITLRLWEVHAEVAEREERATRLLHEANDDRAGA